MDSGGGTRTGILFVNAPRLAPLGADTWIHLQILRELDRTRFAPVAACVTSADGQPTPCYDALRQLPDAQRVPIVPIDFGPELSTSTGRGRLRTVWDTLPALGSFVRLARVIRRRNIEIVHTSDRPRDAFLCVLLAKVTRTTCIIHVHVGYGDWMSRMLTWSLRQGDALIAVSAFVAQTLIENGYDANKIFVVRNAIDTERWHPGEGRAATRTELAIAPDAPVILSVCRLFESKGPRELVEALPALRSAHPDVRLVIVGREVQEGFRDQLEKRARELSVDGHLMFTGQRSDIGSLMAAADVYAMPSQWEPFGLVFAEAMAMKLPVVALDNGGTPEVVVHGECGLLSPLGDQAGLTTNLLGLLADPPRRAEMGERGRAIVLERFMRARMARDVEGVYEHLVPAVPVVPAVPDRRSSNEVHTMPLQPTDIEALAAEIDANGYAVLRGVVPRAPLTAFARTITEAWETSDKFKGGGTVTGHLNCFPGESARFAWDALQDAGVVDAAKALRTGRPDRVRATMNFNLPRSVAQHFHIDGAYLDDFLICNLAVVDTTVANGAMAVLPGSNREFLPFWKYALSRRYRTMTRLEMRAGDVLLRKSNLWHRGMPNLSAVPRPLLSFTFGERSAPDGDPFAPNGGAPVFYANWYSTSRAGQLRERMYKTLPVSYGAYRFVDSLRRGKRGYASWEQR